MPTVFNPRSPYGERHAGNGQRPAAANFNPRSPCGERLGRRVRREPRANFNPRPPCGERLLNFHIVLLQNLFQSTLPVWGATEVLTQYTGTDVISIHAPRVGSDFCYAKRLNLTRDFNPRSPCGERLPATNFRGGIRFYFNPRSPCGERLPFVFPIHNFLYFNPRSPCGERPLAIQWCGVKLGISIHAPRVGSDTSCLTRSQPLYDFNPRSPCGERRRPGDSDRAGKNISIHAPRVGSDQDFVIKAPAPAPFQSTLPVWGATRCPRHPSGKHRAISIHAPRVGSDNGSTGERNTSGRFQSTLPVWGATELDAVKEQLTKDFNPRSPCGERPLPGLHPCERRLFQSTLPVWGATAVIIPNDHQTHISIHAPRVGSDHGCSRHL